MRLGRWRRGAEGCQFGTRVVPRGQLFGGSVSQVVDHFGLEELVDERL